MKLELTLPALERLIGGDTELEVALRRQVAQEFAFRYLKGIVDEDVLALVRKQVVHAVEPSLKKLLDARIGELKRVADRYVVSSLDEEVAKRIDTYLAETLNSRIQESVSSLERDVQFRISAFVAKKATEVVESTLKDLIRDRVAAVFAQFQAGADRKEVSGEDP